MRYVTEIFVDNMEMLTPKGGNAAASAGGAAPVAQNGGGVTYASPAQSSQPQTMATDNSQSDDLPF